MQISEIHFKMWYSTKYWDVKPCDTEMAAL